MKKYTNKILLTLICLSIIMVVSLAINIIKNLELKPSEESFIDDEITVIDSMDEDCSETDSVVIIQ